MMLMHQDDQCWYKIINDKIKVEDYESQKLGIRTDKCVECKFIITSLSYQQNICGSRYCKECFEKLKPKYYCSICKLENSSNIVHKRENIFADKAMKRDLEKIEMKCPDCDTVLKLINLEDHVRNLCSKGWKMCYKCQNMHKKNTPHECPGAGKNIIYKSPYKQCERCGKDCKDTSTHKCDIIWDSVCPYGCEIEIGTIETHRKEKHLRHLDKAWSILNELGSIKDKDGAPSVKWIDPIADMIKLDFKDKFKFDPKDVKLLTTKLSEMNKEMTEEKEIYKIIESNLQNQMTELQNTSFDGTIMWRIDDFSTVKDNAIKGTQKSIFSPPFYSNRFGYKMCLRLYPNGDTSAFGIAMSLFLVIMKGNYDSMLKWPFKQKVTFILVDPEFKTNWIDAFIPSENTPSFSRPRTNMNIPSGSSYFIKFEDMNQNPFKYAKSNTLFIRCIVDCSDL